MQSIEDLLEYCCDRFLDCEVLLLGFPYGERNSPLRTGLGYDGCRQGGIKILRSTIMQGALLTAVNPSNAYPCGRIGLLFDVLLELPLGEHYKH